MATDLSKSSANQLYDLILEDNTGATAAGLTFAKVTFGAPADHAGANPGDTDVVVTAVANSGFSGDVTVNYDRLDLAGFTAYGAAEVTVAAGATVTDIVAAFNALYGAALDISDYDEGASAPIPDDDGEIFTLVADATSLAYKGSIAITVFLNSVALNTVITTTNLNGLEFPA